MSESELDDAQLASRLAIAAGEHLLRLSEHGLLAATYLGAHGDRLANTLLTDLLRRHRPGDGLLSEEKAADDARLSSRRGWIVDPLDGTREYAEGRADWAAHVGLVMDGIADPDCAVCLPAPDQTFSGSAPAVLPTAPDGPLKILVSRTRAPRVAELVAQRLGAQLIPMGSAGAKAMAVVRGEVHAYLHAGGQYESDSCAPVGVALAAGFHASRIDGSPCRYNQAEVFMPDVLICRPELAVSLLSTIAECLRHEECHHA